LKINEQSGFKTDIGILSTNNDKVEVDFYVPEDKLAVQASYSIAQAESTFDRELDALKKLPKVLPCDRRVILTYDESDTITDEFGTIEVMPLWKWIICG
jgi:hypothetical protein